MLHLRGVKLQLGLKPLRRNLTHSIYSVRFYKASIHHTYIRPIHQDKIKSRKIWIHHRMDPYIKKNIDKYMAPYLISSNGEVNLQHYTRSYLCLTYRAYAYIWHEFGIHTCPVYNVCGRRVLCMQHIWHFFHARVRTPKAILT